MNTQSGPYPARDPTTLHDLCVADADEAPDPEAIAPAPARPETEALANDELPGLSHVDPIADEIKGWIVRDFLARERHDDPDPNKAAAIVIAILLSLAGCLLVFGAAWRFGWVAVS